MTSTNGSFASLHKQKENTTFGDPNSYKRIMSFFFEARIMSFINLKKRVLLKWHLLINNQ